MRYLFPPASGWLGTLLLVLVLYPCATADEGGWFDLLADDSLSAWKDPAKEWFFAGSVGLDPDNPKRLAAQPGHGILVNGPAGRVRDLITKQSFRDVEAHVEFL